MGCGGSKDAGVIMAVGPSSSLDRKHEPANTPAYSSSGVSSYRHTPQESPAGQNTGDTGWSPPPSYRASQGQQVEAERDQQEEEAKRRQEQDRIAEEERRLQEEERRRQQDEEEARDEAALEAAVLPPKPEPDVLTQGNGVRGNGGRTFTPPEIADHNAEVGWIEWIPHKRKVYDGNGIRDFFPGYMHGREDMLRERARIRVAEGGEEEETEFVTVMSGSEFNFYWRYQLPSFDDPQAWTYNGVFRLRASGISEEELDKELPQFLLGTISCRNGPEFFDLFRKDVSLLLADLQGDLQGTSTGDDDDDDRSTPDAALHDYTLQVKRWLDAYRNVDPAPPASDGTDPNTKTYPLAVDPESLRLNMLDWEPFDCQIPPEGAWLVYEPEDADLGDPDETFQASLRDNFETEDFSFDVEGEAAWEVLPGDAIKEDQLTPSQEMVQAARDKRTDLDDPERMKRRREQLCDYFIQTRELAPDIVMGFLQWASVLEEGQAQLDRLCQE